MKFDLILKFILSKIQTIASGDKDVEKMEFS